MIDTTGVAMTVKTALDLISRVTAEVLDEFVGDLDNETRWAMGLFREHGFESAGYDDAKKAFVAANTLLESVKRAGSPPTPGARCASCGATSWPPAGPPTPTAT